MAWSQDELNPPAPLVANVSGVSPGGSSVSVTAARRAQDLGLPLLAVDLYRQVRDAPGADRVALNLELATALLDAGQAEEAEKVLEEIPEPRSAAWHLRAGLAAVQLEDVDAAREELAAIRESELPTADLPWFWFFQGEMVDLSPDREVSRANDHYIRAERAAPTELARARIQLGSERLRFEMEAPREADLKVKRENYERHQGTPVGYDFAEKYALALDALGQSAQAVTFLQGVLVSVQPQQRDWWHRLRLVLGLIGDKSRNGAGRVAFSEMVESGNHPERQRQALQLLWAASLREPERGHFRALLQKLIALKPDHVIKESLLFFRAQLALTEKDYALAEEDADTLLKEFPLSPLRTHAFGVLTQSAWEQRRFRQAAANARKAREALQAPKPLPPRRRREAPPPPRPDHASAMLRARADFLVLEAEAWFRGGLATNAPGDFRLAADAYAAVVREAMAEIEPGKRGALMFQRVLAEIKSGSGDASKVLDELTREPNFDVESRWRAEWELVRALQLRGDAGRREAFGRVTRVLGEARDSTTAVKPELRARMAWLQARLSLEIGEPEQTIQFVEAFFQKPLDVDASFRTKVASTLVLLKAQAEFELAREPVALETLKRLRAEYPTEEATVLSFLIESEHYAKQDRMDDARNRLISLTDNPAYKDSEFVPFALYRLALLSERLGRKQDLEEANKRIEVLIDRVEKSRIPGQGDLIFAARFKQGDIFRKLSEFPRAQAAYEDLVNHHPRRPDVVLAQLALAETHNAQSAAAPGALHAEQAQLMFEQLRDRVDAPRDVRVEAGYNLGALLARRGKKEEAAKVWWRDVITPFLLEEKAPMEEDAKRPYWLARTLRELGELQEGLGRINEAIATYQLMLAKRLPFAAVARARLIHLGAMPAPTP